MKKNLIILSVVLAVGLAATTTSCTKTATSDDAGNSKEATEQVEAEQAEPETPVEPTSFTTSQGTFYIKKALKDMYDAGVRNGTSGRNVHDMVKVSSPKSTYRSNAEKQFKGTWAALFGIPDNDEAKAVFEQAKEQYMKGFEDGWNF